MVNKLSKTQYVVFAILFKLFLRLRHYFPVDRPSPIRRRKKSPYKEAFQSSILPQFS